MADKLCSMRCESRKNGRVIIVVYEDWQILDVSGPAEALQKANIAAEKDLYDITLVAAQPGNSRRVHW